MILVIADPSDAAALWLQRALAGRVSCPVEIVTPVQLVCAPAIVHRQDSHGGSFRFRLACGRTLTAGDLSGVVNRMIVVPSAQLRHADPGDRSYAEGELFAFLLGWLASLRCPMLNEPSPDGLAGPYYPDILARHFAAIAGLASPAERPGPAQSCPAPPRRRPTMRHFVLDGRVIGPILPAKDRDALLQFGRLWGARLVQVDTDEQGGRRHFLGATSLVDFPSGGAALVAAVAQALGS